MIRRAFLGIALLALSLGIARADLLDDGRALYKAGKFAEAAVKLEQATREEPKNAKAWWQLNFAYNKLGRHSDALRAVIKADQADPSHAFASEPGKYEETLSRLKEKAGAAASTPTRGSNKPITGSSQDGITKTLLTADVYVAPGLNLDMARLQRVATSLPAQIKFVVFNSRSGSATLSREADRIRKYLGLKNGYVIVGSRAGVAASSEKLDKKKLRELTGQVAPMMEAGDYVGGLEKLARGLVATTKQQQAATSMTWMIVLGLIGGGILLFVVGRKISNARAMAKRREPIERLKSDVISAINFLDDQAALCAPAVAARVREIRVNAGRKLDEGSRLISRGKTDRDMQRAEALLEQAMGEVRGGRALIDRAQSGQPLDPIPVAGASAGATDWSKVPENERAVCFFCSMPAKITELTPVTVNLSGSDQKVLACAADLRTIKTGQMPNIRAFQQDGKYVPWYADNGYDPYRDYNGRGYNDRSFVSDMVTLSLIDSMFWGWHHPMGWGWGGGWGGGYMFYPGHHHYHDYYSSHASDHSPDIDAGGTDFLQGADPDLGSGGYSGSGDFLGGDQS